MTASAARRAAFFPMPLRATTAESISNSSTPSTCCARLPRSNGASSMRIAVTIATGLRGIAVRQKPLRGAPQSAIDRARLPSQFALGLSAGDKHLFPSHADSIQRDSWLALQHLTGDERVH